MIALLAFGFTGLLGFCAGNWFCIKVHMRPHKPIETAPVVESPRMSGIESYWMEQGETA